jgi:3-methyladenine DNA glycosylase AlkC
LRHVTQSEPASAGKVAQSAAVHPGLHDWHVLVQAVVHVVMSSSHFFVQPVLAQPATQVVWVAVHESMHANEVVRHDASHDASVTAAPSATL